MKIQFHCLKCADTTGVLGHETLVALTPIDSGLYDVRCRNGHSTPTLLQQMRFEILFEVGIHAIQDGYYREAISSFAAALERFYEFYISLIFKEKTGLHEIYKKTWKNVSRQSERQIGAYLFLYALRENEIAPHLKESDASFRNNVIHKGQFPTRDEAINFGNKVLEIINPIVRRLKERSYDLVHQAVQEHALDIIASAGKLVTHGHCLNTTISLATAVSVPDCIDIRELPEIKEF